MNIKSALFLAIALPFLSLGSAFGQNQCSDAFKIEPSAKIESSTKSEQIIKAKGQPLNARPAVVQAMAEFAAEHGLPYQWVDLGPNERKVRRLVVAIDYSNPELMAAYRSRFNLDTTLSPKAAGTLVIEQTRESVRIPERYVYTYIRATAGENDPVYRWGGRELPWKQSFDLALESSFEREQGIDMIAELVDLTASERDNVKLFLENPDLRGPCKSSNCVAWMTGAELGKTAKDATEEERKYLFNELGISRTIAPFEIARRLVHASNDRMSTLVLFVNGPAGAKNFKEHLQDYLPPEPKQPYSSIVRGVEFKSPAYDALSVIPDGAKIFIPIAAGASPDGVEGLIDHAKNMKKGVDVHVLVNGISAKTFKKGIETTDGKFRVHALFLGGNLRQLYKENKVSVIPGNLSDFTRLMRDPKQKEFQYDAMVVRVSPPDKQGFYSLGPNNDMILTIMRLQPHIKIIAEVNPNVPYTTGKNKIHRNQIAALFESKTGLAGPPEVPGNEVDTQIGLHLGKLIDSGATLQIGIGNVFSEVPKGLREAHKTGIKISTEMFGDAMMHMLNEGTAERAETGFAYGSGVLYDWLNRNPKVVFREQEYVNDPGRVARTPKFHAVNTALQVDLFGQVNATMGPEGRMSSPGGQVEFMTGAARSPGGKAIIAIRSTAKNGELSAIVMNLYKGPITTPHESVTHVVTEYGVAELAGKNEQQRAVALINIAHPKFRRELFKEAQEAGLLPQNFISQINFEGAP